MTGDWQELITQEGLTESESRQIPARSTITLKGTIHHYASFGLDVNDLFQGLDEGPDFFLDPNQWMNPIQTARYDRNYFAGLPEMLTHRDHVQFGRYFVNQSNNAIHLLMRVSSLASILRQVQKENAKFNHEYCLEQFKSDRGTRYATMTPFPFYRDRALGHECHYVYGVMEAILDLKKRKDIGVEEVCCSKRLENLITKYYFRHGFEYARRGNTVYVDGRAVGQVKPFPRALAAALPEGIRSRVEGSSVVEIVEEVRAGGHVLLGVGEIYDAPACVARLTWRNPNPLFRFFNSLREKLSTRKSRGNYLRTQLELTQAKVKEALQEKNRARIAEERAKDRLKQLTEYVARNRALRDELVRNQIYIDFGKYSSGIIHNLKSKLAGIDGFNELIGQTDGEDQKKLVEIQAKAIGDAIAMTKGLMRSVRASQQTDRARVLLSDLVEDTLEVFRGNVNKSSVAVIKTYLCGCDPVEAVPSELMMTLDNLLQNAVEAVEGLVGRGTVIVRTRAADGRAYLEVVDDGVGIEICDDCSEDRCLTCDRFAVGKTTKPQGTGIGILFVRETLMAYGGTLHFVTKIGEGTSVVVSLPLASDEAATGAS